MRKFISIVLAVAMLVITVGIVTANAENYTQSDYSASSTVTFRQPSTFCVYIPDMIDLDYDYTIQGVDMNLSQQECLKINITNLNSDGSLTFESEDGTATLKKALISEPNLQGGATMSDLGLASNCVGFFLKGDNNSEVTFGLSEDYYDFHSDAGMTQPPAGRFIAQAEFEINLNGY